MIYLRSMPTLGVVPPSEGQRSRSTRNRRTLSRDIPVALLVACAVLPCVSWSFSMHTCGIKYQYNGVEGTCA